MMNRIADKLIKAGLHAHASVISAGLYYDGTQHGELLPCVRVTEYTRDVGHDRRPIEKAIKAAIRNNRRLTYRRLDVNPYYYVYEIAECGTFERANALQAIAECFLTGFWEEIHNNPHARDNNATAAIQAGHARLAAAGYMTTAA